MDAGVGDPRLRLVYEESLRALQDQREALNNLRSRAGQLLTAASIIETFLVGIVLRGERAAPGVATWVGVAAFVSAALVCVWIVLPARGWAFGNSATILLTGYVDAAPPATLDEMHRNLAVYMEGRWDRNQDELLNKRMFGLQVAAAFVVVCILAAVVDVRGRGCHGSSSGARPSAPASTTANPGAAGSGQAGPQGWATTC
ncbi:MAG TPA: hypothetical protein VNA20_04135 [Frankiaceae bacterium]|nr:hypothetical protein [Frankiaceae bacterium]